MTNCVADVWPPKMVALSDWDNGAGMAVLCAGVEHRVVRRSDALIAFDHPNFEQKVNKAKATPERGQIALLGYRDAETGFLYDDLGRWRKGHTWVAPRTWRSRRRPEGRIPDPDALAPCVRLVIEGFAPIIWCGNLLPAGTCCPPDESPACALSSGMGWKNAIPPGWVQGTQIGPPYRLSAHGWPARYRWIRNGLFTHHAQTFLASPWWPAIHARRLKNLVCEHAADNHVAYRAAFEAASAELISEHGPMTPPPITNFTFYRRSERQ